MLARGLYLLRLVDMEWKAELYSLKNMKRNILFPNCVLRILNSGTVIILHFAW